MVVFPSSLKILERIGWLCIYKLFQAGLNKTYRLNPYIAHKGKNRDDTIVEFEKFRKNQDKPEKF